jgi:enterochelin esterase family protein
MRAQVVMDNLIYRREIPVMIGVFINPGRRPEQPEPIRKNGATGHQPPTEYNSLDDKYARVIVDELLPALYKDYNISKDPSARHRWLELGRDRRVHRRLGAPESLPQSA